MKKTLYFCLAVLLCSCSSRPDVPTEFDTLDEYLEIYPDYREVTVPSNIAPLNFMVNDSLTTEVVARLTWGDGKSLTFGQERKVLIGEGEWKDMLEASAGSAIKVELFGRKGSGSRWTAYKPFNIMVAPDRIDDYISYRLIQPGYMLYDRMSIAQRKLSSFEEKEIFNNKKTITGGEAQCINCHSYQNYKTDNMLFHVRVNHGGTIIVVDGKPRKVNLKRDNTISAGVYPAWHPTARLIAFSTNITSQWFHTRNLNKAEVFDSKSDLILYDIDSDEVTTVSADSARLEVFPAWAPDGRYLYYCSGEAWENRGADFRDEYKNLHYNLYRRSFDPATKCFGEEELVYAADTLGRSVSLPRISPDGKFVCFALGAYGCFNIWHHESDIRVMCLVGENQGRFLNASGINSRGYAESYPSWSSNGKWLMCASRRDDGNYSRVYISYFDGKRIHRAFELPQADPEHNIFRLKSYNRPEFMTEGVGLTVEDFAEVVLSE